MHALAARGNRQTAKTVLPSLSNPARATFSTGAGPDVHGVTNNGKFYPPPVQSLFSIAKQHGVPVAVFGSDFWSRAFGEYLDPSHVREFNKEQHEIDDPETLIAWQNSTCDEMIPFLAAQPKGLLIAGLTAADEAGHDWGGKSEQYESVARAVDACLGRVVQALDDGDTTFVIASDHGHIQRRGHGGHGGSEGAVTNVPLLLVGKAIKPGQGMAWQLDIAPTIAALLGLPIPASNQGTILFDALDLDAHNQQALELRMIAQGKVFAERTPNRQVTEQNERSGRLLASLAAGLGFLLALGFGITRIPVSKAKLFWAVATFLAVYAGLFYALGLGYSLSAIIREEYLNSFFLRNIAAAAVAFLCASFVAKRGLLWLGLIVIALFGLRVAIIHYRTGLFMQTLMPDLDLGLTAYLDLLSIFTVAVTACLAALVASRLNRPKPAPGL
ncbi:MAG: alkaline phosphatase family protein [Bryobacterales bacterium]